RSVAADARRVVAPSIGTRRRGHLAFDDGRLDRQGGSPRRHRTEPRHPGRGRRPDPLVRSASVRTIEAVERRARLARRHRLTPGSQAMDVEQAAESMVCLHATDPSTFALSSWARVDDMTVPDLERALYVDRSLVKHLAMRRTLFVFPRERLADAQAGAGGPGRAGGRALPGGGARVRAVERRRLADVVEKAGLHRNGTRWLQRASSAVIAALSDG